MHTLVAGNPLLADGDASTSQASAQALCVHASDALDRLLASARGQFCMLQFDVTHARLRLATDALGIRPLYYGAHEGVTYFAPSLRALLTACPQLGYEADIIGQAQRAVLGFNLEWRTPYARIATVAPGQVVEIADGSVRAHSYALWPQSGQSRQVSQAQVAKALHERFVQATQRRLTEGPTVTYLSGGLDSRCAAAALAQGERTVHTVNFAPSGSADLALGACAAKALGTEHFEVPEGPPDFWGRAVRSVQAWQAQHGQSDGTETIVQITSGFGGEGVLAPTNMTASMLDALRRGRASEAVDEFLRRFAHGVPRRMLQARWRNQLPELLRTSILEALTRCPGAEPGQQFHMLLLMNELRGLLAPLFEDMDLHRMEWSLPFCDLEFVRLSLTLPTDALLQHRFYYEWLNTFGPTVSQVPWQAYPDSLPCPHALPEEEHASLRDQWVDGWLDRAQQRQEVRILCGRVWQHLMRRRFPSALLSRSMAWLALGLTALGLSRYAYSLRFVDTLSMQSARVYRYNEETPCS